MSDDPTQPGADRWPSTGEWSWSDADDLDRLPEGPSAADRYIRGATLHDGTMSAVRVAEDPLLRRSVIVKTAPGQPDGPIARRLLREARITAALDVPGVPRVLDAGTDPDGRPWFVLPVLHGDTLAKRLEREGPGPHLVAPVLQAARIVAHAHTLGIVHRDLKPEHILIAPDGRVHVLDWGIARPASASSEWDTVLSVADHTGQGIVLGTPAYMSPEQVIGAPVDTPSDVWALGACLFTVLRGHPPFPADTTADTLRAVVHAPIPTVDGPVAPVLARSLQRDPEARYPHAGALADALEAALQPAPTVPPARRSPAMALIAAGVALTVGLLGGWQLRPGPTAPPSIHPPPTHAILRAHARTAIRERRPDTAALLAATGLLEREDPVLRGIVAAKSLPVTRRSTTPLPPCERTTVSDDSRVLLCREPNAISLVDLATGATLWRHPVAIHGGCMMPDLILVWRDGELHPRAFDRETGESVDYRVEVARGQGVSTSPVASRCFARSGSDGQLRVDLTPEPRSWWVAAAGLATPLPDGTDLIVEHDRYRVLDGDSHAVLREWPRVAHSAGDGPTILRGISGQPWVLEGSLDGRVRLVHTIEGTVTEVTLPRGMVHDVAMSPDGTRVAATDERGGVWIWPRTQPEARRQLPTIGSKLGFVDDHTLVVLDRDREVWDLAPTTDAGLLDFGSGLSGLDLHDGYLAVATGDGTIIRRHRTTGATDSVRINSENVAKDVTLGPSGSAVGATLSRTRSGFLWTDSTAAFSEQCRRTAFIQPDQAVCQPTREGGPVVLDHDGRTWPEAERTTGVFLDTEPLADRKAAVLIDDEGGIWTIEGGRPPILTHAVQTSEVGAVAMHTLDGPVFIGRRDHIERVFPDDRQPTTRITVPDRVLDLAVSPDGRWLAAGLVSGDIRVWRTSNLNLAAILSGHTERVSGVAFDDDSRTLGSASWDHTVRLWDLSTLDTPPPHLQAAIEGRIRRGLEDLLDPR